MKRIALALIACAGLGMMAGQSVLPTDSRSSEPGPEKSAVTRIAAPAPVETPLVEKLLVKEKPATIRESRTVQGGTLTADGFFSFDSNRNAWIPVDHGHPRYDFNDAPVTLEHLIADHGHALSSAKHWTRAEIEIAHANSHWWEKTHQPVAKQKVVYQSGCPGGVCPSPSRSRGLFRRR